MTVEMQPTPSPFADEAKSVADRDFSLCLCGLPRWRHADNEDRLKEVQQVTFHTEIPHHLFMSPSVSEPTERDGTTQMSTAGDPHAVQAMVDVADALRCTTHIDNRGLRAAYIVTDLKIRGYVLTKRGAKGRFERADR